MSITRKAVIAAVAALALGGSMVGSTAPADAHNYNSAGTVTAKEANKLFKEVFKQKCLTVHEARHIAHGNGVLEIYGEGAEGAIMSYLTFDGTKKSHFLSIHLSFEDRCAYLVDAYRR